MKLKNKERLTKSLEVSKSFLDKANIEKSKKEIEEKKLSVEIEKSIINNNQKGATMKSLSKSVKHDLALIKLCEQMDAITDRRNVDVEKFGAYVTEYSEIKGLEEKAIALTSDHTNLLRNIQGSDIIFSFDNKSEAGKILSVFKRYNMPVIGKVTLPIDNQAFELEHYAETATVVEQDSSETLLTLEVNRAAMVFKISRTLQFKSIVDRIQYVESFLQIATEKGMVEGIINGQGSSPQVDSGYGAKKMGQKFAGVRAILAANSYSKDMSLAPLTGDTGRTAMQSIFDFAGSRFSSNQAPYVILCARREKLLLSALKQGSGVTGVNQSAGSAVYANDYLGIPLIETGFLKSVVASGSGYDATGFVSATAADNDHGVLILLDPSSVTWALESERIDVEFKPESDSFVITLNAQAGWTMLCDARNQTGVYAVNIGADIV